MGIADDLPEIVVTQRVDGGCGYTFYVNGKKNPLLLSGAEALEMEVARDNLPIVRLPVLCRELRVEAVWGRDPEDPTDA